MSFGPVEASRFKAGQPMALKSHGEDPYIPKLRKHIYSGHPCLILVLVGSIHGHTYAYMYIHVHTRYTPYILHTCTILYNPVHMYIRKHSETRISCVAAVRASLFAIRKTAVVSVTFPRGHHLKTDHSLDCHGCAQPGCLPAAFT